MRSSINRAAISCSSTGPPRSVAARRAASLRIVGAARRQDVLLAAGPRFGLAGAFERYLRVPYTLRRDRVEPALDRLVAAWHTLDESHPEIEPVAVA